MENNRNMAPTPSPDGTKIAMYSDRDGEFGIYILSLIDCKFIKRIILANRTAQAEELHILRPGISWSQDNEKIIYAAKSDGNDVLMIYNIKNNKKNIIKNFDLEGITRPVWNTNNNLIAFIGNDGNASDVYIYDLDSKNLRNLTNDFFSDVSISWHTNGKELISVSD